MPDVDIEGPDGKTYSFPDGTDKAGAIKYFQSKGIGAPRSASSPIPPPAFQPTKKPTDLDYTEVLSGEKKQPLGTELKDMASGVVKQAAQLSTPGLAATLAKKLKPGAVSSLPIPHAQDIERAALSPEEYARQAEMVTALPAAEGIAGEGEAAAVGSRPSSAKSKLPEPPKSDLTPEQTAAVEKANRGYQSAKAQIDRKTTLEATSKDFTKRSYDNIQRTYQTARGSLDQRWGAFRKSMEGAELDPAKTFNDIEEAKGKYLKGSPASLAQFNNLAKEMGIQEFMEGAGGELKAIPGTGQLPFDTARVHYSAIGDKLAQGNLPGNVYQALKSVQESLDGQLSKAADSRGLGKDYSALKGDERQFRSDWVDPKSPLAKAHKALDANYADPILKGRGNEYLTKQLERYKEHGADPNLPGAAKHFADRAAEITKRMPEVKELPPAKGPKASKTARTVGRIGGKLVGGTIGSAVGHPLLGYSIGGEAGQGLVEQAARRRAGIPPPPE